jgi:menaquinone-dependent protoporphyrinogen oxidase
VKVLIAYATKYGTTGRIAERVREGLSVPAELVRLNDTLDPPLAHADVVLVGGSIYAGRIRPQVTKFCERHQDELLARPVGLFVSCLYGEEQGGAQIGESFPGWLLAHAFGRYNLGGAVAFSQLRVVDRFLMQKIGKVSSDIESINEGEIERLTADVAAVTSGA